MRVLCRRTTPDDFGRNRWADISIPVLRVEDDRAVSMSGLSMMNFNPRPPCGGRRAPSQGLRPHFLFQSTSSVWRTTLRVLVRQLNHILFQSTSSVWRTTNSVSMIDCNSADFNPRPPCGGRHPCELSSAPKPYFNPRPPCGGRRNQHSQSGTNHHFNPRPPCGGRQLT